MNRVRRLPGPGSPAFAAALAVLCVFAVFAGAVAAARAEQLPLWETGLGATVISFPHYRGSDERRSWVLPFPYVVYRGEFLQADEQRRLRGLFFKTDRIELDVSLNAMPPVNSDEDEARRGMPDLDATVEIGPSLNLMLLRTEDRKTRVELRLPVRAVLATDFSHLGFAGWVFQPNLNVDARDVFGYAGWTFGVFAGPMFADRKYHQYYYGVDPAFATGSRPAYNASGGYAGAQVVFTLGRRVGNFWAGGFARWDTLSNAVFVNSPLVKTHEFFAGGIAVAWILGESVTRVEP